MFFFHWSTFMGTDIPNCTSVYLPQYTYGFGNTVGIGSLPTLAHHIWTHGHYGHINADTYHYPLFFSLSWRQIPRLSPKGAQLSPHPLPVVSGHQVPAIMPYCLLGHIISFLQLASSNWVQQIYIHTSFFPFLPVVVMPSPQGWRSLYLADTESSVLGIIWQH